VNAALIVTSAIGGLSPLSARAALIFPSAIGGLCPLSARDSVEVEK
jgi:hypothetical protein